MIPQTGITGEANWRQIWANAIAEAMPNQHRDAARWSYRGSLTQLGWEFMRNRRAGMKYRELAKLYGVSTGRAQQIMHQLERQARRAAERPLADLMSILDRLGAA